MATKSTGLSGSFPFSHVTLDGLCYGGNGFDRNFCYDGVNVTNMGIRMTGSAPTQNAQSADGSMTLLGVYNFRIEYWNANKAYQSSWSDLLTVTLTGSNTAVTLNIPADSSIDSQVTHARIYRTIKGGAVYYLDTSQSGGLVAFTGSAVTFKSTLIDTGLVTPMGALDANGNNVNVHAVGPTSPYMALHEGRILLAGRITYSTGTVTMAASTTVEGAGTPAWAQGLKGMKFQVAGDPRPYTIDSITDSDTLVLTESYAGSTGAGKSYTIFGQGSFVFYSYIGIDGFPRPESFPADYWTPFYKDEGDTIMGMLGCKNGTIIAKRNRLGLLSGSSVEEMHRIHDVTSPFGTVAHATLVNDDDKNVIGLADDGIFVTDGVTRHNITKDTIMNIITGTGNPPWKVEKSRLGNAHAVWDKLNRRYMCWVASDGSSYEDKCIVLDFNTIMEGTSNAPSPTVFNVPATSSALIEDSNRSPQVYFENTKGFVNYFDPDSTNDGAGSVSTVRGTVTSATSTVITDTTATFTDAILGCPVKMLSGTSAGETGWVSARTTTTFTVGTALGITPVAGDVFALGYIDAYRTTKFDDFRTLLDKAIRRVKMVFKIQSSTYSMYIEHYVDFSTTQLGDTKYIDMANPDGYHSVSFASNRAKHHQLKMGICDTNRPFELREMQTDINIHGKPKEDKEVTS